MSALALTGTRVARLAATRQCAMLALVANSGRGHSDFPPGLHPVLASATIRTLTIKSHPQDGSVSAQGASKPSPSTSMTTPKERYGNWTLPHPTYTRAEMEDVKIVHHPTDTLADKFAASVLFLFRKTFDLATRYPSHKTKFPRVKGARARPPSAAKLAANLASIQVEADPKQMTPSLSPAAMAMSETRVAQSQSVSSAHDDQVQKGGAMGTEVEVEGEEMDLAEMRKRRLCFGPEQWLTRIIFLETIAGAPGLVAGMVRHLQSLRLMRRDKGWIATLLEEAENERMHLLTFLSYAQPGRLMRLMILLAQGVFTNAYFIAYLLAPRIAHRWIGYLEEEACVTYTRILQDLDEGRLPEWEHLPAPPIALSYWSLPPTSTMRDVLLAVRADESVHRFVNHSLASVGTDAMNPFAQALPPASVVVGRAGWSREEAEAWADKVAKDAADGEKAARPTEGQGPTRSA